MKTLPRRIGPRPQLTGLVAHLLVDARRLPLHAAHRAVASRLAALEAIQGELATLQDANEPVAFGRNGHAASAP
jgi:hypothetical protein